MSSISAGTTSTTALVSTADTTGALVLKTGASATTAVTIDSSQNVTFAGTITGPNTGGNYILNQYTSPATWTKPTNLKAVKVKVVGAGGAGVGGFQVGSHAQDVCRPGLPRRA